MWDPLDRYAPNDPLLRGASAGLVWLLGMTGLFAIIADPIAALFVGPFVVLAGVFSAQLARSAYRGEVESARSAKEIEAIPRTPPTPRSLLSGSDTQAAISTTRSSSVR